MKLSGDYTFEAPREAVWDALQDPEVLARIMPGTEKLEAVGEGTFLGRLKLKVGPVQGKFNGKVLMTELVSPESFNIQVDGKGPAGFVKGGGAVRLEADGSRTILHYEGEGQVGGRIASVGQRLIDTSARSITRQSLDSLGQYLEAKHALSKAEVTAVTEEADVPMPQIQPPTQTQVAVNLARDVAADFIPEDVNPILLGGIAIVILLLLSINRKLAKLISQTHSQ